MGFRDLVRTAFSGPITDSIVNDSQSTEQKEDSVSIPAKLGALIGRMDGLLNEGLGLGPTNSLGNSRPSTNARPLSTREIETLRRFDPYSRKIITQLPNDATRKGWGLKDSDGSKMDTTDIDNELQISTMVKQADTEARTYGGAHVLIVTNDTEEALSKQ